MDRVRLNLATIVLPSVFASLEWTIREYHWPWWICDRSGNLSWYQDSPRRNPVPPPRSRTGIPYPFCLQKKNIMSVKKKKNTAVKNMVNLHMINIYWKKKKYQFCDLYLLKFFLYLATIVCSKIFFLLIYVA